MRVTLFPRPHTSEVSVIVHDGVGTIQAWRQPAYAPIPYPYEITEPWEVDDSGVWTTSVAYTRQGYPAPRTDTLDVYVQDPGATVYTNGPAVSIY